MSGAHKLIHVYVKLGTVTVQLCLSEDSIHTERCINADDVHVYVRTGDVLYAGQMFKLYALILSRLSINNEQ